MSNKQWKDQIKWVNYFSEHYESRDEDTNENEVDKINHDSVSLSAQAVEKKPEFRSLASVGVHNEKAHVQFEDHKKHCANQQHKVQVVLSFGLVLKLKFEVDAKWHEVEKKRLGQEAKEDCVHNHLPKARQLSLNPFCQAWNF